MIGLALSGRQSHLDLLAPLVEQVDFLEVCPEQLWDSLERLSPRADRYATLGKPLVAHGLGLSLGTPGETERVDRWLAQIARLHQKLDLQWYTDHLGASHTPGGLVTGLHQPLPHTEEAVAAVRERFDRLRTVVPLVGFENTVFYYTLEDPFREAAFYNRLCRETGARLLLDLHNLYTHCRNFALDRWDFVAEIELANVLEIHLSGGSESDQSWLEGPALRLDSHDGPVPEEVWELAEAVLPRCPNLKGVTLERIEGTVKPEEIPHLSEELARLRAAWNSAASSAGK